MFSKIPKRIEVLTIGDELLDGRVADTNTLRLAEGLHRAGARLDERSSVRDLPQDIVRAVHEICERKTELCFVSGGLGPTEDDLTAKTFAQILGETLVRREEEAENLKKYLLGRGREISEQQLAQVDLPKSAEVLKNPVGTAPGFTLEVGICRFICLPGVPREFDAIIKESVLPKLEACGAPIVRKIIRLFGVVEAEAEAKIADLYTLYPDVRIGFRVPFPETHIRLEADSGLEERVREVHTEILRRLGRYAFDAESLPHALVKSLSERKLSLGVAESCTGGLIGDLITNIPGSSAMFLGGLVSYGNAQKQTLLGVKKETLEVWGAVSEQTAGEMAEGARDKLNCDIAVATTGIAGPGGGSIEKPVGLVWIAVAQRGGISVRKFNWPFERQRNKRITAYAALSMVYRCLDS